MRTHEIARLAPHEDVNAILVRLADGVDDILCDALVGLYLTGSLTYGDFDPGSSDIDYLAILHRPLATKEHEALRILHAGIAKDLPVWADRIEGSYITADMLDSVEPPREPRPYVNGGDFWDPDPRYGNEWLINLFALQECGIVLVGPDPRDLIGPVDIGHVREASLRDLLEEWVPRMNDPAYFESSHHQAYVSLTLCRILHRAGNDGVVSKRVASAWVKETYDFPWITDLVERAERWRHGEQMHAAEQVRRFIEFTRDRVVSARPR